jgi:predicted PurR-regulated permease PerM
LPQTPVLGWKLPPMLGIEPRTAQRTWTVAAVLLSLLIVYLVRQTLFVFVIALMFAYLLYPLFDALVRRLGPRHRGAALAITYILVLAIMAGFGFYIGNHVAEEAGQFAVQIRKPGFAEQVRQWRVLNIPVGAQLFSHYSDIVGRLPAATLKILAASTNLIYLVIVPILSFFILKDGRQIRDSFLEMLNSNRKAVEDTLFDAHTLLLQYMRALLTLCLATLIVFSIALSLMGVPYAALLAAVAFPLEFIPVVGPLTAAALIISVTVLTGSGVLSVIIFLAVYRMFQDYVLSPHLMSKGVELHPLLVIFGIFAGEEIGGIKGVFLSVPVLALLRLLYFRLRKTKVPTAQHVVVE